MRRVSSISRYFEQLVADLTDKSQRDPKTKLMNFAQLHRAARVVPVVRTTRPLVRGRPRRYQQLQVVQRRARPRGWRSHHRPRRAAAARAGPRAGRAGAGTARAHARDLHARFGGDEFCFLIPDLADHRQAYTIAERFREAVERYDWTIEDHRLAARPVRVDVGVVCLRLGGITERRRAPGGSPTS